MNITELLLSQLGDSGVEKMASKVGADKQQTSTALEGIMPTLLGAMSNNAKSEGGAQGILGALDRDHDGSVLDDIAGFLGKSDFSEGNGILKHVLGEKRETVETGLSQKTGLNAAQIGNLLQMAAPLVMGYLGRQKKQGGAPASAPGNFDQGGLAGLLGGLANDADKSTGLDLGDILNVVGGLTGGNSNSGGGGIGGILGKLFR